VNPWDEYKESSTVDEDRALSDEEPWYDAEKKPVLLGNSFKKGFDNIEDVGRNASPNSAAASLQCTEVDLIEALEAKAGEKLDLFPNPDFDPPSRTPPSMFSRSNIPVFDLRV
jgi:hypothetical protein